MRARAVRSFFIHSFIHSFIHKVVVKRVSTTNVSRFPRDSSRSTTGRRAVTSRAALDRYSSDVFLSLLLLFLLV